MGFHGIEESRVSDSHDLSGIACGLLGRAGGANTAKETLINFHIVILSGAKNPQDAGSTSVLAGFQAGNLALRLRSGQAFRRLERVP